jgi:hypothetical protein
MIDHDFEDFAVKTRLIDSTLGVNKGVNRLGVEILTGLNHRAF